MATSQDLLQLSMLPLQGFGDPTATVATAKDKWTETKRIVTAVQSSGITLGSELQQSLDNLKYYCDMALQALASFTNQGGSGLDQVLSVQGLEEARSGFSAQLPKAQALFTQVQQERGQTADPSDPNTKFVQGVVNLTQPYDSSKMLAAGMVLGGFWLLTKLFK